MRGRESLRERLHSGPPVILDGALGTELERRGVATGLPLWSSHALLECPEVVGEIHRAYVAAGAEVLTANTFRTQRRTLANADAGHRARELTELAVALAREAAGADGWVAGSVPPLEDCYHPERVPPDSEVEAEQTEHVEHLAAAGVDLLLIETMNTIREAVAALRAARARDVPTWVSFVCTAAGNLLSGESLNDAIGAALPFDPQVVLVNCLPPSAVPGCLPSLRSSGAACGVYANLGEPNDDTGFSRSEDCSPDDFAVLNATWVEAGVRVVGGCCGTTPDHIARIAERLG